MKNKQPYFFHLIARNKKIILQSEMYRSFAGCISGSRSVFIHAQDRNRFFILRAKNGQPYFVLKANNAKVIGVSETYSSLAACRKGIAAVMNCVAGGEFRLFCD